MQQVSLLVVSYVLYAMCPSCRVHCCVFLLLLHDTLTHKPSVSLSAYFNPTDGGGLACCFDARGFGSANYLGGSTALTASESRQGAQQGRTQLGRTQQDAQRGFALLPDGAPLASWGSQGGGSCGAIVLDLGGGLGVVYTPPPPPQSFPSSSLSSSSSVVSAPPTRGVATVFWQCRGAKYAFSQDAGGCMGPLSPSTDLFGAPRPDKSPAGGGGGGGSGTCNGHIGSVPTSGVRALAAHAAALPALSHAELLDRLRGATAALG